MRLFVGIALPDALKRGLGEAAGRIRTEIDRAAPGAVVRWIDTESLHITLWFLGEVGETQTAALKTSLHSPVPTPPFPLVIGGAGAFPEHGLLRALWFGIRSGRENLLSIHSELRRRLTSLGFQPEERPYSPHLTVARVKAMPRRDVPELRRILQQHTQEIGRCEVGAITLFRSRPSSGGSQYESLLRVPLV
jgi:2'-5' RNA ligase